MALVARPKPTVSHKKRRAAHHRRSKRYLAPYWPYLPLFAIAGGGVIVNKLWSAGLLPGVGNQAATAAEPLTRAQIVAGSRADQVLATVIILSGLAAAIFLFRHGRRLQRWLIEGEKLAYEYAWLDVVAILIVTVGVVLTRP